MMSRPEIAIQKKIIVIMEERNNYVKRTQRDYSMSFKLNVVKEIESGELSTTVACRKYGIQARSTVVSWLRKFGIFTEAITTHSNEKPTHSTL